jgi:hypothetical protein
MGCHYGHHAYLGDPTKPELSDLVLWGCLLWQWLKTAEADGLKKSEFKVRVFPNLRRIWGSQSWETRTGWKRAKLWGVKKSIAAWWFTDLFFFLVWDHSQKWNDLIRFAPKAWVEPGNDRVLRAKQCGDTEAHTSPDVTRRPGTSWEDMSCWQYGRAVLCQLEDLRSKFQCMNMTVQYRQPYSLGLTLSSEWWLTIPWFSPFAVLKPSTALGGCHRRRNWADDVCHFAESAFLPCSWATILWLLSRNLIYRDGMQCMQVLSCYAIHGDSWPQPSIEFNI